MMAETKAVSEMLCFEKPKTTKNIPTHQVMFKDRMILELTLIYMVASLQF